MNKILLIAILFTIHLNAQECKYEINKIDDFSKTELLLTKSTKLVSGYDYNLSISIGAENKNPFLTLFANYERSVVVGSVDPSFFILLNDGDIMEFTATKVEGGRIVDILYPISVENLKRIKNIGIKKVKLIASRFSEDYEIKKVDKKLIQNIECILNDIEKK